MNKNKILSIIFTGLALIDTHLACIVITNDYVHGIYAARFMYASAPAWLAFLWFIPFGFGLLLFSMLAYLNYKKYKASTLSINNEKTIENIATSETAIHKDSTTCEKEPNNG